MFKTLCHFPLSLSNYSLSSHTRTHAHTHIHTHTHTYAAYHARSLFPPVALSSSFSSLAFFFFFRPPLVARRLLLLSRSANGDMSASSIYVLDVKGKVRDMRTKREGEMDGGEREERN